MAVITRVPDGQQAVEIQVGRHSLRGFVDIPPDVMGMVAFVLRSGRGRFRSRNQYFANVLHRAGIATLMLDLLDEHEADARAKMFNVDVLVRRIQTAIEWARLEPKCRGLDLGCCGMGLGAASALKAAAAQGGDVKAVVACGGRAGLADDALARLKAPALLIVGSEDLHGLAANRRALEIIRCKKQLSVVTGASRLFTEPGALEQAAALATDWFLHHLGPATAPANTATVHNPK